MSNVWGTDPKLIADEFCQRCEREVPSHYDNCDRMGEWTETDKGTWVAVLPAPLYRWRVVEGKFKGDTSLRESSYPSAAVANMVMGGWIQGRTIRLDKTA